MGKDKGSSVEIPSPPSYANSVMNYSIPGLGNTSYANNTWGFNLTPEAQAEQQQIQSLKNSILAGLGITSSQREQSLNQWQDTFVKEALRTSQPQLEQSLFARGLGGSRYYSDALTDLLTKVNTQGVLNRESLSNQDQQLMLQQLAGVGNLGQQNYSNMYNLLGQSTGQSNQQYQNAINLYQTMLPYLAKVNQSSNLGGLGSLLGTGLGALFALPTGGMSVLGGSMLGGSLGGGLGSMIYR
jgi:hypothetical protein